jgi:hypothetical protein
MLGTITNCTLRPIAAERQCRQRPWQPTVKTVLVLRAQSRQLESSQSMSERVDHIRNEIAELEQKSKDGRSELEEVRLRSLYDLLKVVEAAEAQVERIVEADKADQ